MKFADQPRCQLHSRLVRPGLAQWLRIVIATLRNRLRLRSRWRAWRHGSPAVSGGLGTASRFAVGSWVRVREPGHIFATLNAQKSLRGLPWNWQLWPYCGTVHQVFRQVRRMLDDNGQMRAISTTVLLDSVPCSGPHGGHGCGRECPMMFRDEWLEEVSPPPARPLPDDGAGYARVRDVAEIKATLDTGSARHGLLFMPEMYAYAGRRFRIRRKIGEVLDGGRRVPVSESIHLLEGLYCSGAIIEQNGPCQRACRLLWHEDWLQMESATGGAGEPERWRC